MPDPALIDIERYWDGHRWSAHTRDAVTKLEVPDPRWASEPDVGGRRTDGVPIDIAKELAALTGEIPRHRSRRGLAVGFSALAASGLVAAALISGQVVWGGGSSASVPAGPDVDYPVFGSDDFSLYLARNLVAQEEAIDVSWVSATSGSVERDVRDAYLEAAIQNPYVYVDPDAIVIDTEEMTLIPAYTYGSGEADRRRARTAAAVEAIIQSNEVRSADGEVALAEALYDALIDAATYDVEAAEDAALGGEVVDAELEAYGALVAGDAVGEGYARAYQALAEAAGLTSVVVTGTAYDGDEVIPHAWNMVLVGGAWLAADAAFDDRDGAGHDYFLLSSMDTRLSARAINGDWVLDQYLWGFGT